MSQPSKNYIEKLVRWVYGGLELTRMNLQPAQQFRARLALDAYHMWQENKSVNIRRIVKNIAQRDYANLLAAAETGNPAAQEMVADLKIRRDPKTGAVVPRSEAELCNDIYTVNQLVGRLAVAKNHIQRAMYEDNIEWLMQFGRKTGNVTAMREAQRNLEKLNNDFKQEEDPAQQLEAGAGFGITDDVSVVKADRQNYTDEQIALYEKKYGITKKEHAIIMEEQEDGSYAPAEPDLSEEPDPDEAFFAGDDY